MASRTEKALLGLGIDSAAAKLLIDKGFTAGTLKAQSKSSLQELGLAEFQVENILVSARPPIPEPVVSEILFKSKWTCCICREANKAVIVHHLIPWSESRSHSADNLVLLCLDHHGEAHTVRQLSLNLTSDRIRDARARWYLEAETVDQKETERLANMIANDHRLLSIHRGAMPWSDEASIIFGNDGSIEAGLGPPESRTRRQIHNVQLTLQKDGIAQLGFATSASGSTWVILATSNDVGMLREVVWNAFWAACDAEKC